MAEPADPDAQLEGTCAGCSDHGVLPGVDAEGRATCRRCSGIMVPVDCARCGAEDVLYRAGTCYRCALDDEITGLLTGPDDQIAPELVPLAISIRMPSANSGITWLRTPKSGRCSPHSPRAGHRSPKKV